MCYRNRMTYANHKLVRRLWSSYGFYQIRKGDHANDEIPKLLAFKFKRVHRYKRNYSSS